VIFVGDMLGFADNGFEARGNTQRMILNCDVCAALTRRQRFDFGFGDSFNL
jgi:hypothetical protein